MPMGIPAQKVQLFLWEYKSLCKKHGMIVIDQELGSENLRVWRVEQEDIEEHIDKLYAVS